MFTSRHTAWFVFKDVLSGASFYIFVVQWVYFTTRSKRRGWHDMAEKTETILLLIIVTLDFGLLLLLAIDSHLGVISDSNRTAFIAVSYSLYSISMQLTYSVLWLRQRVLYEHKALSHLTNKFSRFVSKYFIFFMITTILLVLIMYFVIVFGQVCDADCYHDFILTSQILWPCSVQMPLLVLFLHPLLKHRNTRLLNDTRYVSLMKRMVGFAATCLITDVATAIITARLYFDIQLNLLLLKLVVNPVCVILTPANWKARLFPWTERSFLIRKMSVMNSLDWLAKISDFSPFESSSRGNKLTLSPQESLEGSTAPVMLNTIPV